MTKYDINLDGLEINQRLLPDNDLSKMATFKIIDENLGGQKFFGMALNAK